MTVKRVTSGIVHAWCCSICDHQWETYGGDPYDDPELPGENDEPPECPHCDLEPKAQRMVKKRRDV